MMTSMFSRRHSRRPIQVGLGCLLLAALIVPVRTDAADRSCSARLEEATKRSFAKALRCAAREKQSGTTHSACHSRAASTIDSMMEDVASCAYEPSPALEKMDHCMATVLSHVSDNGRCAARKMRAVARSVTRRTGRRGESAKVAALCRSFERAGSCAGDCLAVDAALTQCWTATSPQNTLPAVAPDDRVVLFGTYEGDAISSTTLAGQDEETVTARVVIESGTDPLYVLLTSFEPIVWRFEGNVSRVRQVVLLSPRPQGVTGVAADRVSDLMGTESDISGYFYEADSSDAEAIRDAVEDALGRPVDVMAGSYSVGTLSLPSATVSASTPSPNVPAGFDPDVYRTHGLWFQPGGVVDINPALVISASSAESYEVLPQGFGLAQLVATGGLETRGGSFFFDAIFYIANPIPRFPAGLYGAHSVTFVLGTGVPMPAGSPGHSCVLSEETGLPLTDGLLCGWYEPPTSTCELPGASDDAQIIVFGAYEADAVSTVTIVGPDEETQTARVDIEPGSTPLYLVLTAYENIIWRFEGDTARLERVVLAGYGRQGVTGLPGTLIADYSDSNECLSYFYDVSSPDASWVQSTVEESLGRTVDVIAGSYSVGTLSLPSATVTGTAPPSTPPPGLDPLVYQTLGLWFHPGGIVEVDPAVVVSSAPAELYDVLPQGFGLAQLVATGALEPRGDGFFFGGYFYIASAIPRFPAGLYGAHSVTFVLGTGVPYPAGSPGHSCVMSEETGLPLANDFICPRDLSGM